MVFAKEYLCPICEEKLEEIGTIRRQVFYCIHCKKKFSGNGLWKYWKIELRKKGEKCHFCGNLITTLRHSHINIERDPNQLNFCSNKCKISWIYRFQEESLHWMKRPNDLGGYF